MPIGPFDSRAKRSRCLPCAKSHVKCSGGLPCNTCDRRGVPCEYPKGKTTQVITLDHGKHNTSLQYRKHVIDNTKNAHNCLHALQRSLHPDQVERYFYFFQVFVQSNTFNPQDSLSDIDIERLFGYQSANFFRSAILAIGAMEASKARLHSSSLGVQNREDAHFAITSYSASIIELRAHMDTQKSLSQIQVLWTTLFLGLFELLHDSTGTGWVQHMVHGTSKAVAATGPEFFCSEPGQRFFAQARMFEACRAIVFNDPTFLTGAKWLAISGASRDKSLVSPTDSFNSLLVIVSMCSELCVRVGDFVENWSRLASTEADRMAVELAREGSLLRMELLSWSEASSCILGGDVDANLIGIDPIAILSRSFFSATSIYLSGIFDYHITLWGTTNVSLPTLDEQSIQNHVENILYSARTGLDRTNLSRLLYLFPLRVAGARCVDLGRRQEVIDLLERVRSHFTVAVSFQFELQELWRSRGIY